jgi:hypothetical protein
MVKHVHKNRGEVVAKIWNVYQMLLEEIHPVAYEMVTSAHKKEMLKDLKEISDSLGATKKEL